MGGVLGILSEEGVDEYMSCEDHTPEIEIDDPTFPRTFRLRDFDIEHVQGADGTAAGRVAHALVSYGAMRAEIDHDFETPNACCLSLAFAELVEQFHETVDAQMLKIPKTKEAICWCISRGYPVAAALPVTEDVAEHDVAPPKQGDKPFALVPVVLWGYSTVSKKFAAYVPLSMYDEAETIAFDHVFHEDSCDFFLVDVAQLDDTPPDEPEDDASTAPAHEETALFVK